MEKTEQSKPGAQAMIELLATYMQSYSNFLRDIADAESKTGADFGSPELWQSAFVRVAGELSKQDLLALVSVGHSFLKLATLRVELLTPEQKIDLARELEQSASELKVILVNQQENVIKQ